jgi:hypothetical protein
MSTNPKLTVILDSAQAQAEIQKIDAQVNQTSARAEHIKTNLRLVWREFTLLSSMLARGAQENAAIQVINMANQIAVSEFAVYQTILHASALLVTNPVGAGILYAIAGTMQASIIDAQVRKVQIEQNEQAMHNIITFYGDYL